MKTSNPLTAEVFSAFLKCQTKAYLMAVGETPPDAYFADIEERISARFKAAAKQGLSIGMSVSEFLEFQRLKYRPDLGITTHLVDCDSAAFGLSSPPSEQRRQTPRKLPVSEGVVPVLFVPWDKLSISENLLLCFGAVALEQLTGVLPTLGTLVYGEGYRQKNLKIENHLARTHEIIGTIKTILNAPQPPPLVLNRHCTVCDYQRRCRGIAIERDDLSLLTAMTAKDRTKSNGKGVFTITQLSYGYRPRRRKRTRPDLERAAKSVKRAPPPAKNDHKLRALAIKKGQIHVVGAPSVRIEGTPIFVDVEGMPDRDFYYLIGIRYETGGNIVEHSFWADTDSDEGEIWEKALHALKEIENVQIVSYGAYEIQFLRQMKERYPLLPEEVEFVERLIEQSINLLGCIYGTVYFPTFSNSLKEVGRYLGFEWTWPNASGAAAPLLRRGWELGIGDDLRRELVSYNMDDCRAASTVANALVRLCGGEPGVEVVDVGSLEVAFQQAWGKFDSALPAFTKINDAAYWDYQRDRVYVRSNPYLRKAAKRKRLDRNHSLRVNTTVRPTRPCKCPACSSNRISMTGRHFRTLFDMRFYEDGQRKWITKHIVDHYECRDCQTSFASEERRVQRYRYSDNVVAYVIYNIVELNISQYKLAKIMQRLFGYPLLQQGISRMIKRTVQAYRDTYEEIKRKIVHGNLIHADETHVSIKGRDSYVWVFASMEEVIYIWSETREGSVAKEFLGDFSGVLVSDFYSAYESIECPQQKCLIHLLRDLNDHIHQEPFNTEVKQIALEFGSVLEPMIDTIDRFGLKAHFLKKHKLAVERFYNDLLIRKYDTELARAVQKRFKRNQERLFTFLDYDNVPWNNNNAEHAIKSFADLRDVIGGRTTELGIHDYLILLSIYQTCVYRGVDFLGFLRSGEKSIDAYHGKRDRKPKLIHA